MATGREERMQQRLRGAQRHQVQDLSFGSLFPGDEDLDEIPAPLPRTTPNSSAKRRRLETGDVSVILSQPLSTVSTLRRGLGRPPLSADALSSKSSRQLAAASSPDIGGSIRAHRLIATDTSGPVHARPWRGTTEGLEEEISESPADAPGSGQRRTIPTSAAANHSVRLQQVVSTLERDQNSIQSSSPLMRKTRKNAGPSSTATTLLRNTRISNASDDIDELSPISVAEVFLRVHSSSPVVHGSKQATTLLGRSGLHHPSRKPPIDVEIDELSPIAVVVSKPTPPTLPTGRASGSTSAEIRLTTQSKHHAVDDLEEDELSPDRPVRQREAVIRRSTGPSRRAARKVYAPIAGDYMSEAETLNKDVAAGRLSSKKSRLGLRQASPELGSREFEVISLAEGKVRAEKVLTTKQETLHNRRVQTSSRKRSLDEEVSDVFAIPVQRFARRVRQQEDDSDTDVLVAGLPYASRSGVNPVDVLSQVCDEVIEHTLDYVHDRASSSQDPAVRTELRTKLRALDAFQQELRTRLLELTIALDTLYSLRKKVRDTQKQKLALREEILRVRSERAGVAAQMDAVRGKHEARSMAALRHLGISSTMHNIDLAIEKGLAAPEMRPTEKRKAGLANLELLTSKVSTQACTDADSGGILKQLRDFNAFLERALRLGR